MQLGVILMVAGGIWFILRKRIARRQAVIIKGMLRMRDPFSREQVRGLELVGLLFCSLLFLTGLALVLLHIFWRRGVAPEIAVRIRTMDGITELTQDMAGTYSVRTSSGTAYLICLDEPRHVIRLARRGDQDDGATSMSTLPMVPCSTASCAARSLVAGSGSAEGRVLHQRATRRPSAPRRPRPRCAVSARPQRCGTVR